MALSSRSFGTMPTEARRRDTTASPTVRLDMNSSSCAPAVHLLRRLDPILLPTERDEVATATNQVGESHLALVVDPNDDVAVAATPDLAAAIARPTAARG